MRETRAVSAQEWDRLKAAAQQIMPRAYAPYSGFRVAAAALTETGEIFSGVNIENGSYGLTLCAECSLISHWVQAGGAEAGKLVALVCMHEDALITPCGRCRQLLMEHAGPQLQLETAQGFTTLGELLPEAFDLAEETTP